MLLAGLSFWVLGFRCGHMTCFGRHAPLLHHFGSLGLLVEDMVMPFPPPAGTMDTSTMTEPQQPKHKRKEMQSGGPS